MRCFAAAEVVGEVGYADASIAKITERANVAQGKGICTSARNIRFPRIARDSLFEVKHWLRRAYRRNLLSDDEVSKLQNLINELTPKLSAYINSIGKRKEKADKRK